MAVAKVLARDFTWEIDDGLGTSTFVEIGGLTSVSPSPTKNDADTTDFDSDGWLEHMVASRGLSFSLEGHYLEDTSDGSRDPGQERVEAVAQLVGADSVVPFQITTPGGTVISCNVSCDASPFGASGGGGNDDPASWSATINVSGKPTVA